MKNIFRALALAIFMTAFGAVAVTPTFAQTDELAENVALYKKYTDNYAGPGLDKLKVAIEAGKQYVEKYGSNADYAAQVDFLKKDLPRIEKVVANAEAKQAQGALATRFDTVVRANNVGEAFSTGKQILAGKPDFVDVYLVLASVGFDQATLPTPVDTYNTDTVNFAKTAIQQIEAGKPSTTGDWGAVTSAFRNDKFPDGKSNALGSMNYYIGYILYNRQNQKKEAMPYLYKSLQYNSAAKNNPLVYQTIGAYYFDEAKRLGEESANKFKAASNTETDESKAAFALAKGNADRAIDAYARAYKVAGSNPASKKEYKDGLYRVIQDLYKFRYEGKIDGIDAYIASVMSKPMPDPTTAVTPVVEAAPATATSSLSSSSNTTVDSGTAASSNTSAKSATAPAKTTGKTATAATAKTKAPVKKPAPKKKGTR